MQYNHKTIKQSPTNHFYYDRNLSEVKKHKYINSINLKVMQCMMKLPKILKKN